MNTYIGCCINFYHAVPSKVTIRLIRPIHGSDGFALAVVWSKPSHDSRLRIEYRLQYRVAEQDQWSSSMKTMDQNYLLANLSYSTTYQVHVRGVSVAGKYKLLGEWSEETSINFTGVVSFH